MGVKIKTDGYSIQELWKVAELIQHYGKMSTAGEFTPRSVQDISDYHRGAIQTGSFKLVTAWYAGLPVGLCELFYDDSHQKERLGYIEMFYVPFRWRVSSVPADLLREAEQQARNFNCVRLATVGSVTLTASAYNRFLSQRGYEPKRVMMEKEL